MRKRVCAFVAVVAGGWTQSAEAIPAFARRYDVACHFCHMGYPKLNPIGQRFKERGFRMEREDAFDFDAWLRTVPASVRPSLNRVVNVDGPDITSAFVKGISAGSLGPRVTYWVDDAFLWLETPPGASDGFDNLTHVEPDNAWLRLEVVGAGRLYAKGGRFELDLPFTQTRTPHLLPYEIYFANTGFESDTLGAYHHGVEIGGALPRDLRWSAALVAGRNPEGASDIDEAAGKFDANLFLRLSRRVGRDRYGAFAYIGRNTIVLGPRDVFDNGLLRLGADASVWVERLNLYGVLAYGRNDNAFNSITQPGGTRTPESFRGGFAQADYHVRDDLVLSLRADLVNRPAGLGSDRRETLASLHPGVQYYVRERFKLSFEYAFRNEARRDLGVVQAEIAF